MQTHAQFSNEINKQYTQTMTHKSCRWNGGCAWGTHNPKDDVICPVSQPHHFAFGLSLAINVKPPLCPTQELGTSTKLLWKFSNSGGPSSFVSSWKPHSNAMSLADRPVMRQGLLLEHDVRLSLEVREPQEWRTGFHPMQRELRRHQPHPGKEVKHGEVCLYSVSNQCSVKKMTAKTFTCLSKWFLLHSHIILRVLKEKTEVPNEVTFISLMQLLCL